MTGGRNATTNRVRHVDPKHDYRALDMGLIMRMIADRRGALSLVVIGCEGTAVS
jgi:hypothetical protein